MDKYSCYPYIYFEKHLFDHHSTQHKASAKKYLLIEWKDSPLTVYPMVVQ